MRLCQYFEGLGKISREFESLGGILPAKQNRIRYLYHRLSPGCNKGLKRKETTSKEEVFLRKIMTSELVQFLSSFLPYTKYKDLGI